MSETAKKLFDGLKAMREAVVSAVPSLENIGSDVTSELKRMGTQGTMELASALFGNGAFVPYGPGQYTPDQDNTKAIDNDQERGGMER